MKSWTLSSHFSLSCFCFWKRCHKIYWKEFIKVKRIGALHNIWLKKIMVFHKNFSYFMLFSICKLFFWEILLSKQTFFIICLVFSKNSEQTKKVDFFGFLSKKIGKRNEKKLSKMKKLKNFKKHKIMI